MLEIGSILDGKYKILNKIGEGGMSVVYLAMNERANKQWAIKEVRKSGSKNFEIVRQGLIAEADILKRLRHPLLPTIVDIIEQDDSFLIVMDYVQGIPLSRKLAEEGAQPQEEVIEWGLQLCDVLAYLHTSNPPIIYRDMKPGNIMLQPDNTIMLIDFGTAREFKEHRVGDTTCLGTLGYAAPEQFGGHGQTDARTDIYSLGATLYSLVTGCDPGLPPYELRPIRTINPNLSTGLERIILKCTQKNPENRYQSCAEVSYALSHYRDIDDHYRGIQKRQLAIFLVMFSLAVVGIGTGIGGQVAAYQENMSQYDALIQRAQMSDETIETDGEYGNYLKEAGITEGEMTPKAYRIALLKQAIDRRPEDLNAYEALFEVFEDEDEKGNISFSTEDEKVLLGLRILQNEKLQQEAPEVYVTLCFDVGKLYWYYYQYDVNQDNEAARMKLAVPYFQEVGTWASEDYPYKEMAKVYEQIGEFQKNVARNNLEAADKGTYREMFVQLQTLMDQVSQSDEREIVKLEVYRLVVNSIEAYAPKAKGDGVTKQTLIALLDQAVKETGKLDTLQGTTEELKNYILKDRQEKARGIVNNVYKERGDER